jgi:ABC-type multidrug transport system permease subunit
MTYLNMTTAWDTKRAPPAYSRKSGALYYMLAGLAGIGAGWADLKVDDLLLTALIVLASSMLLGLLQPRSPWRWVVTIGALVPLTELAAYMVMAVKPSESQIYGAFLVFLPGIAGAYGGSLMRGVLDNLKHGK